MYNIFCFIADGSNEEKQQKLLEQAKKRALNSTVLRELKEEYLDTPLEIFNTHTLRNTHTRHKQERERYLILK